MAFLPTLTLIWALRCEASVLHITEAADEHVRHVLMPACEGVIRVTKLLHHCLKSVLGLPTILLLWSLSEATSSKPPECGCPNLLKLNFINTKGTEPRAAEECPVSIHLTIHRAGQRGRSGWANDLTQCEKLPAFIQRFPPSAYHCSILISESVTLIFKHTAVAFFSPFSTCRLVVSAVICVWEDHGAPGAEQDRSPPEAGCDPQPGQLLQSADSGSESKSSQGPIQFWSSRYKITHLGVFEDWSTFLPGKLNACKSLEDNQRWWHSMLCCHVGIISIFGVLSSPPPPLCSCLLSQLIQDSHSQQALLRGSCSEPSTCHTAGMPNVQCALHVSMGAGVCWVN